MRKLALITGGTGAIGSATAALLAPDHDLALVYASRHDRAREVSAKLQDAFPNAAISVFAARLTGYESSRLLIEQVRQEFSHLPDVLVTLSGGLCDGLFIRSDFANHESVLAEHLLVPMSLCHLLVGHMYKNRYGRIVNVGSIAASYKKRGQTGYAAAKSGLESFTKCLALEVAHRGVTANVVAPGLIESPFSDDYIQGLRNAGIDVKRRIPAGYVGTAADVAQVISFLCSDRARYVTGTTCTVDGGRSLGDPGS